MRVGKKLIIFILLTTFIIGTRNIIQAKHIYSKALEIEKAMNEKKDFFQSFTLINTYEKACHLYFPFSPYFKKSIEKLMNLGQKFEKQNETKLAKYAWLAAKGCIMVNRSFYISGKKYLPEINAHISKLFDDPLALERPNIKDPSLLFSILMLAGLFTWIGSVIALIMLEGKNRTLFYLLFVGGYALWIISIYLL